MKPEGQSISGDVRGLIEREHKARALRAAMEPWESAPLVDAVEFDKP